jgi:hypothetical protein
MKARKHTKAAEVAGLATVDSALGRRVGKSPNHGESVAVAAGMYETADIGADAPALTSDRTSGSNRRSRVPGCNQARGDRTSAEVDARQGQGADAPTAEETSPQRQDRSTATARFESETRETPLNDVRDLARDLMIRTKGYADRKSRKANVDRLLKKNFQQDSAPRDPVAYGEGYDRIFGKDHKPKVEYGRRDGYVVRPYRGSVLPMELDIPPEDEFDSEFDMELDG